ncbi:serine/arginine repetitive matrix protein 1-like isoform X24 [Penaeus monodon]|uniref:serine/arginine repetitive matrix protein 1-like isoform X24 n=1 Tax=Penaeus monodon TaxID=6687 RepID=UPI0018A789A7|nr:serine/arginine repetitive matrix protein 1-like isoform X24 [Penaeus monodon]
MTRARQSLTGRQAVQEPLRRRRVMLLQRKVPRALPQRVLLQMPRLQKGPQPRKPRQRRAAPLRPLRLRGVTPPPPERHRRTPRPKALPRLPRRTPLLRPPLPRVRLLLLLLPKVKQHRLRKPLRKKDDPPTGEAAEGEEDVRLLCRRRRLWQPASPVILRVPPKCIFSLSTNQIPSETSNFDADVSIEDVTSKESLITSVVDIDSKLSCYNQHEIYTNCLSKCSALSTNRRASQLWTDCEHLYNCFYINNKFVLLISVCTLTSLLVLSLKKESDVIKKN